ncbi:O-methyltransferase [Neobacillus niacini]|uniref:O-methyltransferase n=1 Tax=Neobacillus niacini TaxID=86668 RepID=UPI002FFF89A9
MLNEKLNSYIEKLLPGRESLFVEMEKYALENKVPIMELVGIEALLQLLRIQNAKKILEVGTAIGYSALRMAEALPNASIVTIERDLDRIHAAEEFFVRSKHGGQIHLIKGDALEVEELVSEHAPYDAIFVDAAKGQYQKFFEIYAKYLCDDGIIITDNVLFKGLVTQSDIESKRIRNLVKKIDGFNQWLMDNLDYHTVILPVGDGIAISKKKR